jgi:glutamyl-tRNA synthetase
MVFGPSKHSGAGIPMDPILLKSDLFPTYHLASVLDDHGMGITHVLRGEVRTFQFCRWGTFFLIPFIL